MHHSPRNRADAVALAPFSRKLIVDVEVCWVELTLPLPLHPGIEIIVGAASETDADVQVI